MQVYDTDIKVYWKRAHFSEERSAREQGILRSGNQTRDHHQKRKNNDSMFLLEYQMQSVHLLRDLTLMYYLLLFNLYWTDRLHLYNHQDSSKTIKNSQSPEEFYLSQKSFLYL